MSIKILLILFINLNLFAQDNFENEMIQDISPNSKLILSTDKTGNKEKYLIRNDFDKSIIFEDILNQGSIYYAQFICDSTVLIITTDTVYTIINFFSSKKQIVYDLNKVFPNGVYVDTKEKTVYIGIHNSMTKNMGSGILSYNLDTGQMKVHNLKYNIYWLLDFVKINDEEFLCNFAGFLSKLILPEKKLQYILNEKHEKIDIGESGVNIYNNSYIFSIPKKNIVTFNTKTRKISIFNEGYNILYPIMAPNGKYFYATRWINGELYNIRFNVSNN